MDRAVIYVAAVHYEPACGPFHNAEEPRHPIATVALQEPMGTGDAGSRDALVNAMIFDTSSARDCHAHSIRASLR